MSTRCFINGVETPVLAADDRGLHYGDGLFETMALIDGRVRRERLHMERLQLGCERLGIPFPGRETLARDIALARSGEREGRAVLKLIVTRGPSDRGQAPAVAQPTRILGVHPWPERPREWATEGVTVRLCALRIADQPALAGLKHLNRLELVLARSEWSNPEIAEGLLCDAQGNVVCGTMSNVFAVRQGQLVTPRVDRSGVAGTVRAHVLQWARDNGLPAAEVKLPVEDLWRADEIFLTNALIGLWPVRQLEDKRWVPGPMARQLLAALD